MTWTKIKTVPGYFEITSTGEVRNTLTGNILAHGTSRAGYKFVDLKFNGKTKRKFVHCLLCESFLPNPENKPFVNHIDGNKSNNSLDNLEWVTKSENELHAYALGLKQSTDYHKAMTIASNKKRRTLPIETIRLIRLKQKSQSNLAFDFGISRSMVGLIQNKLRYTDIS